MLGKGTQPFLFIIFGFKTRDTKSSQTVWISYIYHAQILKAVNLNNGQNISILLQGLKSKRHG